MPISGRGSVWSLEERRTHTQPRVGRKVPVLRRYLLLPGMNWDMPSCAEAYKGNKRRGSQLLIAAKCKRLTSNRRSTFMLSTHVLNRATSSSHTMSCYESISNEKGHSRRTTYAPLVRALISNFSRVRFHVNLFLCLHVYVMCSGEDHTVNGRPRSNAESPAIV